MPKSLFNEILRALVYPCMDNGRSMVERVRSRQHVSGERNVLVARDWDKTKGGPGGYDGGVMTVGWGDCAI